MSATKTFDTMIASVTQERGANYGHPADDFRRAAALMELVDECPDPVIRQALRMVCVKIARLLHNPEHVDSWVDIAGYARCACLILDRQAGQAPVSDDTTATILAGWKKDLAKEMARD